MGEKGDENISGFVFVNAYVCMTCCFASAACDAEHSWAGHPSGGDKTVLSAWIPSKGAVCQTIAGHHSWHRNGMKRRSNVDGTYSTCWIVASLSPPLGFSTFNQLSINIASCSNVNPSFLKFVQLGWNYVAALSHSLFCGDVSNFHITKRLVQRDANIVIKSTHLGRTIVVCFLF